MIAPIARVVAPVLTALFGFVTPAGAQSTCPDPSRPFDYVAGGWVGQQFVLEDDGSRAFVGTTVWTARPALGGCAFAERVFVHDKEGEHVFTARLLRSYDRAEDRWELTEVDDRGRHVHFLGRRTEEGLWGFEIPRVREGRAYVLRLTWEELADDHVRERFERSWDDGETFELSSVIEFRRSPGLAVPSDRPVRTTPRAPSPR